MPDHSAKPQNPQIPNPVGRAAFERYVVAIGVVVVAWGARQALTPLWGSTELPFIFFYPAVVVASWYGRRGPGLLALGLSMLASDWFFIEPIHTLWFSAFRDAVALTAFVLSCLFIIGAIEAMHRAKARALGELTERERIEAELAQVRETFAKALGKVNELTSSVDWPSQSPTFLMADARGPKTRPHLISAFFVAATLLFVGSTIFVYRIGLIRIHAQDRMSSQLLVLQQLDDFLSALKDTETGQRGYLLTADEPYLQPYNHGRADVQTKVVGLQRLARSGELPPEKVERIATLTQQKLSELEQTIQLRRDKGLDAALSILRDNQGKQVMDDIRAEIGTLRANEEKEFAAASDRSAWAANLRTQTFIGACLLNLVFLGWAFRKISDEVRHRESAIVETSEQKELLASTLASIGDAVIVTDAKGNIISLNTEAEHLTGWTNAESSGKFLSEVFHIVDEQTRQPVENPVEKVLRLGTVTGLANHTLLITKDGREIPIDDSAAPIRQPGGPLFGIVLVFRDVSERRAAEAERETLLAREHEMRQLAQDANRLKDEFLAIMSHELRNPLNVILGYSELLVRNEEIAQLPQLQSMAEAIKRNAIAQSTLIRDLLDLSRLRSGKLQLNTEIVSMMVSVNNAIDTVRSEVEAKQIVIETDATDQSLFVEGDAVRLEQIIWNLLNNSVKFTPAGGIISVRLSKENAHVILTVGDSGQGIDPSFLPHVFELFRQGDVSTSRMHSGMGIGLAVVKQLVDLHHGSISGYSAGLGKGTNFTVKLPLSLEIRPEPGPVIDLTTTLEKFAVLVVDDSEDTTEMLAQVLKMSGAIVSSATSGDEALRIMGEKEFDVILSDISMPGMDGFEFLRNLRQLPGGSDVPVLALTGFGRPEDINRAKIEGFFSHVTKPFDINNLMEILQRIPRNKAGPT